MPIRLIALLPLLLIGCAAGPQALPFELTTEIAYRPDPTPRQVGNLYQPAGAGPHPAVLVIHGGGWIRGEKEDMEKFARRFVEAGYLVYNVSYRLAPEYRWPAQVNDVRAALQWLHANAEALDIDPARIGAMGYSAGAHLALMLGLQDATPKPQAVVAGAGPTDLAVYPESPYILKLIGGPPSQYPAAWADASPLTHVSPDDPPTMLYHGRLDRLVEVEQSERLAAALADKGVDHELRTPALAGHITAFLFDGGSFEQALDFFDRHLAP